MYFLTSFDNYIILYSRILLYVKRNIIFAANIPENIMRLKKSSFFERKKNEGKKESDFEKSDTENVSPVGTMAPHFAWQ